MFFSETSTMSVHEEKSESGELNEQIESLQEEIKSLSDQLQSQTDEVEREKLESLISDILAKVEILKVAMVKPTFTTSQTEKWKEQVKAARTDLKEECSDENLGDMMDAVEGLETQVRVAYENVRSQSAPSTEIRRKWIPAQQ